MAKKKKSKKSKKKYVSWYDEALKQNRKKVKKQRAKTKNKMVADSLLYYDTLLVDFWDDDPEVQLKKYQELMYQYNYDEWKRTRKKRKKWKKKMRKKYDEKYKFIDPSFKKKTKKYHRNKKKASKEVIREKERRSLIIERVTAITEIISASGIISALLGPKAGSIFTIITGLVRGFV